MRARPILFSAPMVRAILEGRKTQTRRVVKPQPYCPRSSVVNQNGLWKFTPLYLGHEPDFIKCPYGMDGDRLWVKETMSQPAGIIHYRADNIDHSSVWRWQPSIFMSRYFSRILLEITGVRVERLQEISEADAMAEGCLFTDYGRECGHFGKWRDVGDCTAQVNTHPQRNGWSWDKTKDASECLGTAYWAYANLWNHVNGEGAWDLNPWVWVIEFKRL